MSSRQAPRSREVSAGAVRPAGALPRVAVVGAAAVPGARILDTIARAARASGDGRPPVAIDRDRGRVATAEWRLVDPTDPALVRALRDVDVAVWVAAETDLQSALRVRPTERRDLVVRTAQTLVTAAAAAGAEGVVRGASVVVVVVIAPWAWASHAEYGQPFFSYTNYFQYNFSWAVHHYEKGNTTAEQFYTSANAPGLVRVKIKALLIIAVTSTMVLGAPLMAVVLRPGLCGAKALCTSGNGGAVGAVTPRHDL